MNLLSSSSSINKLFSIDVIFVLIIIMAWLPYMSGRPFYSALFAVHRWKGLVFCAFFLSLAHVRPSCIFRWWFVICCSLSLFLSHSRCSVLHFLLVSHGGLQGWECGWDEFAGGQGCIFVDALGYRNVFPMVIKETNRVLIGVFAFTVQKACQSYH